MTDTFQNRVRPWLHECFGDEIARNRRERNHRFIEEALELVQSTGCTASEAHQLVDYVFGRPVGEPVQETGGVMVTLAALCLAHDLDMHDAGEIELSRILHPDIMAKIKAKQAAKPEHSPLPEAPSPVAAAEGLDGYNDLSPEHQAYIDQHQMALGGQLIGGINQLIMLAMQGQCPVHEAFVQCVLQTADGRMWVTTIAGFDPNSIPVAGSA